MIHSKIFLLIRIMKISIYSRENYEEKKYIYFTYTYITYVIYSSNIENINQYTQHVRNDFLVTANLLEIY